MSDDGPSLLAVVECTACGHRRDVDAELARRFDARVDVTDLDAVRAAICASLSRLRCASCDARRAKWVEYEADASGSESRQPAVACEVCDVLIPPARLDAVPGTTRCVACESLTEGGVERKAAPCNCRRCGASMCWRVRRIEEPVQYFLGCSRFPACRYTEQ